MKLVIRESGVLLCPHIAGACTFFRRLKGLMLTDALPDGNGLHIRPCKSVHSFFMRYPIDVLYLDGKDRIIGIEHRLSPGRIGALFRGTRSVVELPAGTLERAGVRIGQTAEFQLSE